jgi:cytidine deaminase
VGFAVGAPEVFFHTGANVVFSAFRECKCAEASGIGALVAAGLKSIAEAAVIADAPEVCVPCGGCRQRLREFMPLDAPIHMTNTAGERRTVTLEELLPLSFGPEFLP